jgi:DNA-binding response OmpR family regulator
MRKQLARGVLCIGGDPVNLNLRCFLLRQNGWEAESCSNGHEGIFRFAQGDIHLVILDLNSDGAESALIAAELKRQNPATPIIMLVANKEALLAGATDQADAVVLKSEEGSVLLAQVRQFVAPA